MCTQQKPVTAVCTHREKEQGTLNHQQGSIQCSFVRLAFSSLRLSLPPSLFSLVDRSVVTGPEPERLLWRSGTPFSGFRGDLAGLSVSANQRPVFSIATPGRSTTTLAGSSHAPPFCWEGLAWRTRPLRRRFLPEHHCR